MRNKMQPEIQIAIDAIGVCKSEPLRYSVAR